MRTPVLLPMLAIVVVVAAGACSQSLTPNMFGTGGIPAASGGTGGRGVPGTGGVGGGVPAPSCDELASEYLTAVSLAGNCQVGAPGQCQQLVISSLDPCAGCSTYVNDSAALTAIRKAWDQAECVGVVPPCGISSCPAALNNTCVSIDGGSNGYCEYLPPTGTGAAGATGSGTGGSGGAGGASDGGATGPVGAILYPSPYNAGDYMLSFSNVPLSCQNTMPTLPCTPAGVTYAVSIQIPPAELVPGVYPLSSLVYPSFSETGPNVDLPTECWGGGGTFNDGSLEIVEVWSSQLLFRLQGTRSVDFDVNGSSFTAQRCAGAMGAVSTP